MGSTTGLGMSLGGAGIAGGLVRFRDRREVEELWDDVVGKLVERLENGLRYEKNADVVVGFRDVLVPFVMTIEVCTIYLLTLANLMYAKILMPLFYPSRTISTPPVCKSS